MIFLSLKQRVYLLLAITSLLAACAHRIQITEYPEHADAVLATLNTYCWADSTSIKNPAAQENPVAHVAPVGGHHSTFDTLIRTTIDEKLGEKHYRKVVCGKTDFRVDYRINIHEDIVAMDAATASPEKESINPYGVKWKIGDNGMASYEGISGPEEAIITVRHGTIHIGAFLSNNHLVWHSSAEKTLNDRDSDEVHKANIEKAVRKVMDTFPEHSPEKK